MSLTSTWGVRLVLRLDGVHSGYGGTTVLHGLTMEVPERDMVAILGRNGVGKTTLLRAIMGYLTITSGSLQLDGRELGRLPVHARARLGIAYVPQGREIFPHLTVLDNLRVAAFAGGRRDWHDPVDQVLDRFPTLAQRRRQRGGSLSGGQQQILAVARALISAPRVLLLDEPSEGIQPSIASEIMEIVRALNQEQGITVILVEQNLDFAARVARHAYVMNRGEIVRDLPASEALTDRHLQLEYMGI